MSNLSIIGIVVAIIIIGFVVIPRLQRKGIITTVALEGVEKVSYIAHNILGVLQLDSKTDKTISEVLDIVNEITEYIGEYIEHGDDEFNISLDVIGNILGKLGVKVDERQQNLIEILVKESLMWIENNKK